MSILSMESFKYILVLIGITITFIPTLHIGDIQAFKVSDFMKIISFHRFSLFLRDFSESRGFVWSVQYTRDKSYGRFTCLHTYTLIWVPTCDHRAARFSTNDDFRFYLLFQKVWGLHRNMDISDCFLFDRASRDIGMHWNQVVMWWKMKF